MFKIKNDFIGEFKIGDNINHNLRILSLLYNYFSVATEQEKLLLCKPITLILASIIEAILFDFHKRIKTFTLEGVPSLLDSVVEYVKGNKIDRLGKYIKCAKDHDFFEMKDTKFYDFLYEIKNVRNRIHIQDEKKDLESDEYQVFTEKRKIIAEMLVEKIIKVMNEKHQRKNVKVTEYVDDFELPWEEHF
ncbi:MAG: hypothetical protein WC884_04035 [Candidatus Paceibacterota bacterium]